METEIFTVCDFAQDNNGKLTIVGTFDRITPPSFPYVHPTFSVAGRLRFAQKEAGSYQFQLKVNDPEGAAAVPPIEGNIQVHKNPETEYTAINFAVQLNQVRFEKPGKYTLELLLDGDWVSGITLMLTKK